MRVVVVSTHRSDKAHYAPLLRCLRADSRFEVFELMGIHDALIVPDAHFDAGVVLGDRYEMLFAAAQIVEHRIPLLHIHGGEHTYGSLDERWRYAITAIADWHCVANDLAKSEVERYLITGEWGAGPRKGFTDTYRRTANNVVVTGAPGLDDIQERQPFPNAPKIVVLYNPAVDEETTRTEALMIHRALEGFPVEDIYYARPNGDKFTEMIGWRNQNPDLDSERFRDLLAAAHVIVGNSSAGIIEAPSLGTWTVNVGERQAGRPRASSILDLKADATIIRRAVTDMLLQPRANAYLAVANPYGDGGASARIRDVLLGMAK